MLANICPDCGTLMKLLLFSFYCPKNCDKKKIENVTTEWKDFPNKPWKWMIIPPDKSIPEDAKWGYWIHKSSITSLEDLFTAKQHSVSPGWIMTDVERTTKRNLEDYLMVYKLKE